MTNVLRLGRARMAPVGSAGESAERNEGRHRALISVEVSRLRAEAQLALDQLAGLFRSLGLTQQDIIALTTSVGSLEDGADQSATDIAAIQSQLSALQSRVTTVEADIVALQSRVTAVEADIAGHAADIADLDARVTALEP